MIFMHMAESLKKFEPYIAFSEIAVTIEVVKS